MSSSASRAQLDKCFCITKIAELPSSGQTRTTVPPRSVADSTGLLSLWNFSLPRRNISALFWKGPPPHDVRQVSLDVYHGARDHQPGRHRIWVDRSARTALVQTAQ